MPEIPMVAAGQEFSVDLFRFDDVVEDGPEYHGFVVVIAGAGVHVRGKKYDDDDHFAVTSGFGVMRLWDPWSLEAALASCAAVEPVRQVVRRLFGVEELTVLTSMNTCPYQPVP